MNFLRTSPAHPASPNGSGRRRLAAVGLVVGLSVLGAGTAGVAGAVGVQDPAITAATDAFATDPVGVPDVSTTAVASADESSPTTSGRSSEIDSENRRIALIVGGLVVVALALVLLTIRYWRATRPDYAVDDSVVDVEPVARSRSRAETRPGRRSRRAVAGADHAAADETWEPRATGEQPRIDAPSSGRTVRPSRQQRAASLFGSGE